jgi:UDPglucose 6-dehydrogenase
MTNSVFNGSTSTFNETVAILGLGHVGLPTALGLAELGYNVIGADCDAARVSGLQAGACPFYEPGMLELLQKHSFNARLRFTHDLSAAIREASVLFICVGTPQRENGAADLSQVEALGRVIASNLNGYKLIIEKSTVPAVTGRLLRRSIERYAGLVSNNGNGHGSPPNSTVTFDIASNPEFLQEGSAIRDFFEPDRIVCGVDSKRARDILRRLYRPMDCEVLFTDVNTAELIKHAANAFLATKISFINFVADVCDAVGADVGQVARGIGLDPRIGEAFLKAGLGFGGYCLPKDVRAFAYLAEQNHIEPGLLREVEAINKGRASALLRKLSQALWILEGKTIAVLGLAFKAGTDDIREAPAINILRALDREGAKLQIYDPVANAAMTRVLPPRTGQLSYVASAYDAAVGADALLILTEWPEFAELNMARLREVMRVPLIVDGRNLLDPEQVQRHGFEYVSMGRTIHQRVRPSRNLKRSEPQQLPAAA